MGEFLTLLLDPLLVAAKLLRANGRSSLVAEHILLRQQMVAIRRKRHKAPALVAFDRLILSLSSLFISSKRLPKLSVLVAHSTILGFHRALVNRKYSMLFANKAAKKPGPKGPSAELIQLVVSIKGKNPRYGCLKISLLVTKLLSEPITEQMVRRILRRYFSADPNGSGPSWLNVIGKAQDVLWSMDLFCCESILMQTHWVMVVMDHFTREIIGVAVMKGSPSGTDICCMFGSIQSRSGRLPKHLSTDNDPLFRFHRWLANLSILDIDEIKTVPETPWSHPFIERVIGTIRREYLDEILFWNERDLKVKLERFLTYYNEARLHLSLSGQTPQGLSGGGTVATIDIKNYAWKTYCNGRFSIPISA
jgi:putative transposase